VQLALAREGIVLHDDESAAVAAQPGD